MSDPQTAEQLVATISGVVGELRNEVGNLTKYGRRNRHLIKLVAFSMVFDVCLSFGLAFGIHKANKAQTKANGAVTVVCQTGNTSRQTVTDLWAQVLPLLAKTDAEQTLKIKDYIAAAYSQRDCSGSK